MAVVYSAVLPLAVGKEMQGIEASDNRQTWEELSIELKNANVAVSKQRIAEMTKKVKDSSEQALVMVNLVKVHPSLPCTGIEFFSTLSHPYLPHLHPKM